MGLTGKFLQINELGSAGGPSLAHFDSDFILSDLGKLLVHMYLVCFEGFRWFGVLTRVFAGKVEEC
jgi:hypothetical protein